MKWKALAFLILICSMLLFLPQTQATPTLQSFSTEITSFSGYAQSVDVDSLGNAYLISSNRLYKSADKGVTWQALASSLNGLYKHFVWVDSRNYVYVANATFSSSNGTLHRSTDFGQSFSIVITKDVDNLWKMSEMANGTLFINTYNIVGSNKGEVWKSSDEGATWSLWYSRTDVTHFHSVRANPYNDDVWLATGDTAKAWVQRFRSDTNAWENVTATSVMYTDFMFDSTYVYLAPDTIFILSRMGHRGNYADAEAVINLATDESSNDSGGFGFSMLAQNYGDFMLLPTDKATILASIDGERWIKILETDGDANLYNGYTTAWRFTRVSQRKPIFAVNLKYGKLYRIDITAEDIANQIQTAWVSTLGRGTIPNQYTMEQLIVNGENMLYFNSAMKNAEVSFRGFTAKNYEAGNGNEGFELGTTGRYTWVGTGTRAVNSASAHDGAYGLNITTTTSQVVNFYNSTANKQPSTLNHYYLVNFWAKTNLWTEAEIIVTQSNPTSVFEQITMFEADDTWTLLQFRGSKATSTNANTYIRIAVNPSQLNTQTYSVQIDSIFYGEYFPYSILPVADGDTYVWKTHSLPTFTSDSLTTNPSVTIEGQPLTYTGTLTNNTESTNHILISNLEGIVTFTASISGSELALISIQADSSSSSGTYSVTVTVSANYLPVSGATVSINSENKTTNLFGQTTWTLTFGDYVIWAYYQGKNQSQTVSINQDRTLGFNFITSNPPPPPPPDNRFLIITAVIIVAAVIFLTFMKRRK